YWTILIDNGPTAFRAREAHELLPTFNQLKRTNQNVVMKWFSGGKLWESPAAAQEARRRPKPKERRSAEWRPGGQHKDPRARVEKKRTGPRNPWGGGERAGKPWRDRARSPGRPRKGPRKP